MEGTGAVPILSAPVAALAADPDVMRYIGTVLVAASVAVDYGFTDIDGKTPRPPNPG